VSIEIKYTAPPTVAAFMQSQAFFRLIAGPVGSGKTTGAILELLRRACEQERSKDGLRHTRFAIVRQTLKQLKDTVLKDIEEWLRGIVDYKVSDQTVYINFGDVRSEWLLIPLDDPEDQRRLLSMQLTGAWLSEAIEMSTEIIAPLLGRCGRYPTPGQKPEGIPQERWPTWFGAIADTNMPNEGDAWHKIMAVDTPMDMKVFIQPGGLQPDAENVENLPGGRVYYERLARNHSAAWVKRYVHAQYGVDPSGSAVFKDTFKRGFHSVRLSAQDRQQGQQYALEPVYGYPLIVLQDFGRNPCSLICQADHKGRGLVLQELIAEDTGLQLHVQTALKPALQQARYVGRPVYVVGDPAGRAKSSNFEETSFDLLKEEGFRAFPAPTNNLDKRLRSVEAQFLQQRDGGAALLIDEDQCPMLVQALNGQYRFQRRKDGQLQPTPVKNHPWSDVADCLQYFCLVLHHGMQDYIANRLRASPLVADPQRRARPQISSAGWT
jgi:hypothetical protein